MFLLLFNIYIYIYINFLFFESLVKSNFLKRIKKALNLQQIKKNEIESLRELHKYNMDGIV